MQNYVYPWAVRKIANKARALVQLYGPPAIKRRIWDMEFSSGRWNDLLKTPGDCVYSFVEKYCREGNILDLGCGSGNTGSDLSPSAYHAYTGVDVSAVAVQKAIATAQQNNRERKNQYFQSDVKSYLPTDNYDVILFRESIYYIASRDIKRVLDRLAQYLKPGGVFIVRMSDRFRYKSIAELIESDYDVLDRFIPDGVETDSSAFSMSEITDARMLAGKLREPSHNDLVSAFLRKLLSPGTRDLLSKGVVNSDLQLKRVLWQELDGIIRSTALYDANRFSNTPLSPETQKLREQNPRGEKLIRLNRRLLEDAYPQEIYRNLRTIVLVFQKRAMIPAHSQLG
jgi:SAM-dependent methyltransferase